MTIHASARSFPALQARARGFTLTEIAIVLGIIGIILGAIWGAAAMVYENNRSKEAREQALAVINSWRTIYGSRQVDVANGVDMTQLTANNKFEPAEMQSAAPGMCVEGGAAANCTFAGPWTASTVTVVSAATNNAISIVYSNMTQSACNHFGNGISNAAGLVQAQINGGSVLSFPPLGNAGPLSVAQVSAGCTAAGNGNSVVATFSMN